ncbi:hypothetical protein AHiyo8_34940 [Arthrobacter sp. Hiyo8]|nr:hypothetical protein AHiyo8_34940 [Arthrobacter sp. Hiyo8]
MFLVFSKARVAAVDHHVPGGKLLAEFADHGIGDLAGGNHDPDQARRRKGSDQFVNGRDVGDVLIAVEASDLDSALPHAFAHVETHFSKAISPMCTG